MSLSIDSCQNRISADQHHMTVSEAQVSTIKVACFLKNSTDKLLVFNWLPGQLEVYFFAMVKNKFLVYCLKLIIEGALPWLNLYIILGFETLSTLNIIMTGSSCSFCWQFMNDLEAMSQFISVVTPSVETIFKCYNNHCDHGSFRDIWNPCVDLNPTYFHSKYVNDGSILKWITTALSTGVNFNF